MAEPEDDLVVIPDPIPEVTLEQAKDHPELLANPDISGDGVSDDEETPESEDLGIEEIAGLLDEVAGVAASAAAAASSITAHQRRALALALAQKGPTSTVKRDPVGSNCNPYSRYFGFGYQF